MRMTVSCFNTMFGGGSRILSNCYCGGGSITSWGGGS
jgi:hypothetical protein